MTVTDAPTDRVQLLEAKIDLLTDRIAVLTEDAAIRADQRRLVSEFGDDVSRISSDAFAVATRELESLSAVADLADVTRLLRRLIIAAPTLDRALAALTQAAAFVDDAAPLGTDAMALLVDRLADAERAGYFTFARSAAKVADRVVATYDADDVEQLGDNVVIILDMIRQVTQPELLALLGRMIEAVRLEQASIESEDAAAPSFWALARELRDPDVRRGMARALHTLRAVSARTGPEHSGATSPPLKENNT